MRVPTVYNVTLHTSIGTSEYIQHNPVFSDNDYVEHFWLKTSDGKRPRYITYDQNLNITNPLCPWFKWCTHVNVPRGCTRVLASGSDSVIPLKYMAMVISLKRTCLPHKSFSE